MKILFIGPSHVGKSSVCAHLAQMIPGAKHADLDLLVDEHFKNSAKDILKTGPVHLLEAFSIVLDKISNPPGEASLVAVGAGVLNAPQVKNWLRKYYTICLWAKPEEVFERWKNLNPQVPFRVFMQIAYSPTREKLYRSANFFMNTTGMSIPDICLRLKPQVEARIRGGEKTPGRVLRRRD